MTVGLDAISTADVAEFIGFAWLMIPAAFWGGYMYLRVRTITEELF